MEENEEEGWLVFKNSDNSIKVCGPMLNGKEILFSKDEVSKLLRTGIFSLTEYLV